MITGREEQLRAQLAELENRYREEARPLIDELAAIEMMKPKPIWLVVHPSPPVCPSCGRVHNICPRTGETI